MKRHKREKLQNFKSRAIHIVKENFISFILSSLFGIIVTIIVFYLESPNAGKCRHFIVADHQGAEMA
jgi:hypothetical protein